MYLGPPKIDVAIERQWNLEELNDYVMRCYPHLPLKQVGFNYAKCSKGHHFEIVYPTSVMHLASMVKWGKIYIIPKTDMCTINLKWKDLGYDNE